MLYRKSFLIDQSEIKTIKDEQSGETIIEYKLSVEKPDRVNDIVKISGIDLTQYLKNPVVLYNHNGMPIGKGINIYMKDDVLYGSIAFHRKTQLSEELANLAESGYIKAVSIGFIPKEIKEYKLTKEMLDTQDYNPLIPTYREFTKSELIEFSLCSIPANPDALTTEDKSYSEFNDLLKYLNNIIISFSKNSEKSIENAEEKAGAVLNSINKKLITDAIENLNTVLSNSEKDITSIKEKITKEEITKEEITKEEITEDIKATEESKDIEDIENKIIEFSEEIQKEMINNILLNVN